MIVSLGQQVRCRGGDRRNELAECIPVLCEALERERGFRVDQLTRLAVGSCGDPVRGRPVAGAAGGALREVDALVLAGARRALADIERALAAIRTGRYGRCEDCAAQIPVAVLRAVPQARLCLSCHRARSADSRC
jgi:DnaK suppressor protein